MRNELVKILLFVFCLLPAALQGQTVADTCDYREGPVLERQIQTGIVGLLRGTGYCIQPTLVNGGLEMVGGTLSVVDGDTVGQVLRWTGTTWVPRKIIFSGSASDTAYNAITDIGTAHILGGPMTQHTTINGVNTYNLTAENIRTLFFEAQRTGGVAFSTLNMGSTAAEGVNFNHYNVANNAIQAVATINYTGNVVKVQSATSVGAYFQQYDAGTNYFQWDLTASGASSKILRGNQDGLYAMYLRRMDITNNCGLFMYDTITGEMVYQSPGLLASVFGDNWGSQSASVTSPITGNGTSGSPLGLGTVPISKGGTGVTSVGANGTIFGSDGSAGLWLTPTVINLTSAAAFSRSGTNLRLNLPDASTSVRGFVSSSGTQIFGGDKIFSGSLSAFSGFFGMASPTLAAVFASGVHGSSYAVISADSILDETHNFVAVGALSAGITLGLPDCNSTRNGWEYRFVKIGADAYAATIDPNSTQEFTDGDGTKLLSGQYSSATCKCQWDGATGTWFYVPVISNSSGILTASNALTASGSNVKFGGLMAENTTVDADGYTLDITNSDAITFSATGIFGTTSTLSVNSLLGEIAVENGSTKSLLGGNGSGSTYISHENTGTAATARIVAENYQKAALQYIPTGGATSLEYFIDGGATVPGHYQKGMRYKSSGDTAIVADATTGELRRRSIVDPAYMPVFAFTGEIKLVAFTATPTNWLDCDGAAVSRTTYADLFALVGTTFGAGNGTTTFNLPDFRDRFPVGSSGTKAIASTGGSETVTLSSGNLPLHTHTVGIPAATSGAVNDEPDNTKILGPASIYTSYTNQDEVLRSFNTGSAGGGTPATIVPQYTAIRYIICWRGKTP